MANQQTKLTAQYWEERYRNKNTGWDIGHVSPPIKDIIDRIDNKNSHILIPGAGSGYEAAYATLFGFSNVTVLDWSKSAILSFRSRYPEFPVNQIVQTDFFEHSGCYDYIIEQTFFCALSPDLRQKYVLKMNELLKPGGVLTGVLFNHEMENPGPPFGGTVLEYFGLFNKIFSNTQIKDCKNNIPPRAGREVIFIAVKK
jgi:SAM-dependent methyltransferase